VFIATICKNKTHSNLIKLKVRKTTNLLKAKFPVKYNTDNAKRMIVNIAKDSAKCNAILAALEALLIMEPAVVAVRENAEVVEKLFSSF
jgi:hypothetical protein